MSHVDIIVSKFRRMNYTQIRAEEYAAYLIDICNANNLNAFEVVENFNDTDPLYEQINALIMHNRIHRTYITGKVIDTEPNSYIARTIL